MGSVFLLKHLIQSWSGWFCSRRKKKKWIWLRGSSLSLYCNNPVSFSVITSAWLWLCFVVRSEAGDPRLPVWEDQLWADERALHHTQWNHLRSQGHWRAPTGTTTSTCLFTADFIIFTVNGEIGGSLFHPRAQTGVYRKLRPEPD